MSRATLNLLSLKVDRLGARPGENAADCATRAVASAIAPDSKTGV
jgi:hypothetical protein